MMTRQLRRTPLILVVLMMCSQAAGGQSTSTCQPGFVSLDDAIDRHIRKQPVDVRKLVAEGVKVPLQNSSVKQLTAPSEIGTSLVGLPDFTKLVSLAYESGLADSQDGALNLSLTPFAVLAIARPRYDYDQELYESSLASNLRRFSGSLTLGGKGESFDRDGDGVADEALTAQKLDDILTWELRWQVFGSRDRRDPKNFDEFVDQVWTSFIANTDAYQQLVLAVGPELDDTRTQTGDHSSQCFPVEYLEETFRKPRLAAQFQRIRPIEEYYEQAAQRAADNIDRNPIITLVSRGTQRKSMFGADELSFAVRGAIGGEKSPTSHSAELTYTEMENLAMAPDAETVKLGYQYSRLILRDAALLNGNGQKDGATLSFGFTYEWFDNVPDAVHDQIAKANLKVSVPIAEGVELPLSVTWANHEDLLANEEDEIRGHFGLTVDFSKIREKLIGKKNANGS